jgi:hypothetical protein
LLTAVAGLLTAGSRVVKNFRDEKPTVDQHATSAGIAQNATGPATIINNPIYNYNYGPQQPSGDRPKKASHRGIGKLLLDVRDRWTHEAISGAICIGNGLTVRGGDATELPVGFFSGTCSLLGYIGAPAKGEIREGEMEPVRVDMERTTGDLEIMFVDSDGQPVTDPVSFTIDGRELPTVMGSISVVRDLPARKELHLATPGGATTGYAGSPQIEIRHRKWGPATERVTVRGGTMTTVTLRLPVLERRDRPIPP